MPTVAGENLVKLYEQGEIELELLVEQDDTEVRGNAQASGDDVADRAAEDEIIERLNRGDVWAWAYVTVRVSYKGCTGQDSLGGCSYKNEAEFRESEYFQSMIEMALDDLAQKLLDDFSWVTDEMFDAALAEVIGKEVLGDSFGLDPTWIGERVLALPGVWDALAEEFNNATLELLAERRK